MRPLGLGDELRVALRTRRACWGVMCLHREAGRAGFSHRDRGISAKIAPHVAEGLRRALLARHSIDPQPCARARGVILDAAGSVISINDAAERWLAQIPDSDWPSSCRLPLPLLAAASAAGSAGTGQGAPPPTVRLLTIRGDWLPPSWLGAVRVMTRDGDRVEDDLRAVAIRREASQRRGVRR